jgi:hypothetical protein
MDHFIIFSSDSDLVELGVENTVRDELSLLADIAVKGHYR